jgi:hypothetical protein
MVKKFVYAVNVIVALVAGIDCFVWGMGLTYSAFKGYEVRSYKVFQVRD